MFEAPVDIIIKVLHDWYTEAIRAFPALVVAVISLLFFVIIAKYIRKLTNKVLFRYSGSTAANSLISNIVYIAVIVTGIMISLGFLDLDGTVNKLLAGAGIIGLGISFAFQDIIANIFSGAIIALKRIVSIGDLIETNGTFGTVERIGLRTVELHNLNGQLVIIPSRDVLQNPIINYTILGKRRVILEVGVSYSEDLLFVKDTALKAILKVDKLLESEPVEFFYTKFDSSSINFIARFWIKFNRQPEYLEAVSNAIINIKAAFDANNITIPFPIRTIELGKTDLSKLSENKI